MLLNAELPWRHSLCITAARICFASVVLLPASRHLALALLTTLGPLPVMETVLLRKLFCDFVTALLAYPPKDTMKLHRRNKLFTRCIISRHKQAQIVGKQASYHLLPTTICSSAWIYSHFVTQLLFHLVDCNPMHGYHVYISISAKTPRMFQSQGISPKIVLLQVDESYPQPSIPNEYSIIITSKPLFWLS